MCAFARDFHATWPGPASGLGERRRSCLRSERGGSLPIPNVGATPASSRHKPSTGTVGARVEATSARLLARTAADRLPQERLNCVGVSAPWRLRNVRCSRYTLPSNICVGRWRCGLILLMTGYDSGTMGRTRSRTSVPKGSASAARVGLLLVADSTQ